MSQPDLFKNKPWEPKNKIVLWGNQILRIKKTCMMKIWWNRHDQILRDNNSPLDMRWIWTIETSEMD